jgi:hypothetical protein
MANSSIAGRAHGATPTDAAPTTAEYRPQLAGMDGIHPEVARAMQYAFDNLYALRSQVQELQGAGKSVAGAVQNSGEGSPDGEGGKIPNHATGILGININAATDSSTLKNGYTLRYNSKTGEFEFGA